jgi:hypothetical protein
MPSLHKPDRCWSASRLLANDMKAIVAYWQKRMESPGVEEVLPTLPMPCLLYTGEADGRFGGAKRCVTQYQTGLFSPCLA